MAIILQSWFALSIAIVFGVCGTISMKLSHGLSQFKPVVCLVLFYGISFVALTFAIKHIDLSVVYAVWSGIGTFLVAIIGILFFNESVSFKKFVYLSLIIIGVIGIHFSDTFT